MSHPIPAGALAGRTALVTGSSRGIGADTVRCFAQAGANVVINYRNKAPRAQKLAAELQELGVDVLVVGADLTDPASVQEMFDAVKAQQLSARLLELGVYAVGFFYPVVPKEQARVRVQISAVHEREHLEKAVAAFAQAGRELGLVK